ncbi:alpha-amylase family glycosyl hydrolase [Phytomonospora endophytica]|uniref:Maltose alpha-D-glucosyltransferase/alpha-amylase n=1 Tax=Phytomonospora endophytica TaxID=714109 RepID=A0A841FRJ2_9ACTN|nr:alpha-amylase family glycosyl hydrolase [Phytomonospora endophytica]MBB6038845.1 maltose alpha-D-glucosyltransferase/alpha-amylase [Phytomonospora endophytica]GIG68360.1 alpha-amylase [Phytomonospora endophytica]
MPESSMTDLWWKNGLVYAVDVKTFLDGDGDGIGDFKGLAAGIDYLAALGVTCLWVLPPFPSPWRDDGYDTSDYLSIDPRLGDLGDFVAFTRAARQNGIRVILDIALNHTSDEHPWFTDARSSRDAKYRDYYVWSDEPPADPPEPVLPGEQTGTYTFDEGSGQYYLHRYHDFMPDLNTNNPAVRAEMYKVLGFWLAVGVSGFRVDSVPFLVEEIADSGGGEDSSHDYLRDLRSFIARRSSDAILVGEANLPLDLLGRYFGEEGAEEMRVMFDFAGCGGIWASLALGEAAPIARQLTARPTPPPVCSYLSFLRHHDELNLDLHYTDEEREAVFASFAPREDQRAYGRGIRRRMTPMLDDDEARVRLAFSLMFSLPGTPTIFYGDEYGLGDNPELPGRLANRPPMQWNALDNGGFSHGRPAELVRPTTPDGHYGYRTRNIAAQLPDPGSRLNWLRRLAANRRECAEIGTGRHRLLDSGDPGILAVRHDQFHSLVVLHNLADEERTAHLGDELDVGCDEVFADRSYEPADTTTGEVPLGPSGFRWLRLHRTGTSTPGID